MVTKAYGRVIEALKYIDDLELENYLTLTLGSLITAVVYLQNKYNGDISKLELKDIIDGFVKDARHTES